MQPAAHRPDGLGLVFGVALTALAHAALGALLFLAHGAAEPDERVLLPVVSAELLMFGDVMPEDGELPWIANPEEAPASDDDPEPAPLPEEETTLPQQETVVLDSDEPAEAVPEENQAEPEERRPELAERRDRGESNPNRPTNTRPRMGSPDGFEGGTSLSAEAIQNQFAGLVRQLGRALRRPSSIPDSDYRRLEGVVDIRCTSEGQITTWTWVESSGNRAFDSAVDSMLNRFKMGADRLRLSTVTNEELRRRMVQDGFRIPVRGN